MNAAVALSNKMRTKLGEVLLRQRGAYYEFGNGNDNSKDSVFKQTKDVDITITQNIEMERLCGTTDNRLKKTTSVGNCIQGYCTSKNKPFSGLGCASR